MGLQVAYYLVDWDKLAKERKKRGEYSKWYFDTLHNQEVFLQHAQGILLNWAYSGNDWADSSCAYDELRAGLTATTKRRFDHYLGAFLLFDMRFQVTEAPGESLQAPFFALSMSPNTARRFDRLSKTLPFHELRSPFEKYVWIPEPERTRINDFYSFLRYVL